MGKISGLAEWESPILSGAQPERQLLDGILIWELNKRERQDISEPVSPEKH